MRFLIAALLLTSTCWAGTNQSATIGSPSTDHAYEAPETGTTPYNSSTLKVQNSSSSKWLTMVKFDVSGIADTREIVSATVTFSRTGSTSPSTRIAPMGSIAWANGFWSLENNGFANSREQTLSGTSASIGTWVQNWVDDTWTNDGIRINRASTGTDFGMTLSNFSLSYTWYRPTGDSNQDGVFNQSDIVSVLQAGKYMTGNSATWAQGDWNGDGEFDQLDIVKALQDNEYESGAQNTVSAFGEDWD